MTEGPLAAAMTQLGPHQLTFYLLVNALTQPKLRTDLKEVFPIVADQFKAAASSPSRNTRVGYVSLILNMAVQIFMVGHIGPDSGKKQVTLTPLHLPFS